MSTFFFVYYSKVKFAIGVKGNQMVEFGCGSQNIVEFLIICFSICDMGFFRIIFGGINWKIGEAINKIYTIFIYSVINNILQSWLQHTTRHQLYDHLPPITKTYQARQTRHAGHYWRCKDELISDVLLWTPAYGQAKAGRPARTYIQQLRENTGCGPEDLPEAMNDKEKWRERVRDIRAGGKT